MVLLSSGFAGAVNQRSPHVGALSDYTAPSATPKSYKPVFMPDGKHLVERSDNGRQLLLVDIATGKEDGVLFDLDNTRETVLPDFSGFEVSPDGSKILIWRDVRNIYRRSFSAKYYVYEVRSRLFKPLSQTQERQRIPLFSPDSRMVAFVGLDNNVYISKLDYGTEVAATTDGAVNSVINGATDWTYEEEFTLTQGMTWAPDNLTLCYLRFDETEVPLYSLPLYEGTCNRREEYALYPGTMQYKYPVAGAANSKVSVKSYDIETRKTKTVDLPVRDMEYIPRICYGPDASKLIVATLNRDQNHYEIFVANPKSTVVKSVYAEDSKAWIEPQAYEGLYLGDNSFVVSSSSDAYTTLYEYSYTGSRMGQVSDGRSDAVAYYGGDAAGNKYYLEAAPTPMDRTIVKLDRKGQRTVVGAEQGTSSAVFAPGMDFMVYSFNDISTPPRISLCRGDGKELRVLEDNKAYAAKMQPKKGDKEFFTFETAGNILNGYIVKPRNFDSTRRYPVIMSQYSGPGSQQVLNRWTMDWEDYFANEGYIVVCVDGRGTGGRGTAFRTSVYKQLGTYETADQVAAARYAGNLPYTDSSKIGIYGWSYGGYESIMCAQSSECPYAAAVSVAPVTDWRYYDTVYAERYMLTPGQNESGYQKSSAISGALHLSCPLLVIYGTEDDNVHPANALQYVSTLQSAGMLCDMFVFPNMNHSINGCNARQVVYAKMLDYFDKNLK